MTNPAESSGPAIDAQRAICQRQPRSPAAWTKLTRLLLDAGRAAEAIMAVEMALALAPQDVAVGALKDRAVAVIQATEPGLARLELASALDSENPAGHLALGQAYADLDRLADAERCLKRALALDPKQLEAHARLGAVYLNAGIEAGAEHHSHTALALEPAHAMASQTLAAILERRGETDEARAILDRAYARQSLFVQPAASSRHTVLVLATQDSGNIPYRDLMPASAYSRLVWYMEHAREEQAAQLPSYEVVFNTIGDPDLAGPSQDAVRRFLAVNRRPVLNDPDRVAATPRHLMPTLLGDLPGVVVPAAARLSAAEIGVHGLVAAAARRGLSAPLLVRPLGSHGGKGLQLAETLEDLATIGQNLAEDVYLTAYHDYRSADGRFRKARMIFIDRRPYPYHLAVADHWMVHYESSGAAGDPVRLAEERIFLDDPVAVIGQSGLAAINEIGRRLDLHYCGVDFAPLPDGRILVFEANATMLTHTEDPNGPLAHKNVAVNRIISAFQAMLHEAAVG